MKLLLLVNPFSSSVTARGRVVIRKALSADHDVTLVETSRRGHATRLALGAANEGVDVVAVLGGDGTLNEAANGLAGTRTALAALPGGSTNVFARTIGLPNDPIEATGVLLDAMEQGSIRPVGLGSVNGRYFLFHVGMGWDAAVVQQVEKRAALKRYAGHPLFAWCAVTTWMRHFDHSRPRFAVHHPGHRVIDDGSFALVLNTNPYTFLGNRPFDVTPLAALDRPLVSLTVRSMTLPRLLAVSLAALRGGDRVKKVRGVELHDDARELTVTGHGPFPFQVDGDYLGDTSELRFRWEADALCLVLPPAGRALPPTET